MKRAVALMLSVGMLGACFPHNPQARTYAKYTEGALIVAGIAAEAVASRHTGATCDQMQGYNADCHSTNTIYGGVGLALILAGLTGFIATVSTDEDKAAEPMVEVKAKADKPDVKLPPGVAPTPANTPAPAATPADAAPTGADAPQKPAP